MEGKTLRRSFWQRILGIAATRAPRDPACWRYDRGIVTVDLEGALEIAAPGSSVRLEGKDLPVRVLVVHGEDRKFHALHNCCGHLGRRVDLVPGSDTLQCCSVGKSRYDFTGRVLNGPATRGLHVLPVEREGNTLRIRLPHE
ncbi:MAG TPA: Rieske 2Fe-2S domain-containing protein [Candidatus Hydrogenedentes bacterium]|nr:Rieske 2Fe-2S domain-containing protein [Candidatus Hydrogenedentota bacterium]HNT87756.1 Rieske 2Fe-2S domain-containing protein [Candidatus Hydrogenedentota bacterium]